MIGIEKTFRVRPVFAALAIAAAFWMMCVSYFDFNGLYTPDSAEFSILAKSLAAGAGYRDISQPNFPQHTKYPFGYPALLTPAAALFGDSGPAFILACKTITAALGALTLLGVYFFFKTYLSPTCLFALLILCAVNPVALVYSSNVMSEIPLSCFSIWALIQIRYLDEGVSLESVRETLREVGRSSVVIIGLFWLLFLMALPIAAAYYVRGNGIILLPVAAFYFLLRKSADPVWFRFLKALVLALFVALLVLPWVHRDTRLARSGQTSGENYVSQILTPFENPFKQKLTASLLAQRVEMNAKYYAQVALAHLFPMGNEQYSGQHSHAAPFQFRFHIHDAIHALYYIIAGGVLLGLWFHIKRHRADLITLYLAFFIGLLLIFTYRQHRYLIPLMPFGYYFVLAGISGVRSLFIKTDGEGASPAEPILGKVGSTMWVALSSLALFLVLSFNAIACRAAIADASAGNMETLQIAAFIDSASPRDAVLSAGPYNYLFTDRLCVPFDPKSMSMEGFENHIMMYGIRLILAEKWSEEVSDFDLLMQSSINFEFDKLGSVGGLDVYKVRERDVAKPVKKKKQKNFDAIIKHLEGQRLHHKSDLNAWNMLGYAHYQKENYSRAIECFKEVVSMNPLDHVAHFNLGSAYLANGDYDSAMHEFNEVRSTEFGYTIQHVLNRNILILRLMQGIVEDPRGPGVETIHVEVAQLWFNSGVYRKAIPEIQSAIKANPDWLQPRFFLALNYEALGEIEKAMEVYRAVLKKSPGNREAMEKLMYLSALKK